MCKYKNNIKKIAAILLSGIFLLDQTLSFSEPSKIDRSVSCENLGVPDRFNSPITLVWDEAQNRFRIDNREALSEKFSFDGKIALVAYLLGQFLIEDQKLHERETEIDHEQDERRFNAFVEGLEEMRKAGNENFAPFYFCATTSGHGLKFFNSTIQISLKDQKNEKLYVMFVSVQDTKPSLKKENVYCMPYVKENKYFVYQVLGPFDEPADNLNSFAPGTTPRGILYALHFSAINSGAEMKLVWNRDINAACVANFSQHVISSTKLSIEAKEHYFYMLMANIFVSTFCIKESKIASSLCDIYSLKKMRSAEARAADVAVFRYFCTKAGITEETLSKMKEIVDEVKTTTEKKGLNTQYIDSFGNIWDKIVKLKVDEEQMRECEANVKTKVEEKKKESRDKKMALEEAIRLAEEKVDEITKRAREIKNANDATRLWNSIIDVESTLYGDVMLGGFDMVDFEDVIARYIREREANPLADKYVPSFFLFDIAASIKLEKKDCKAGLRLCDKALQKLGQYVKLHRSENSFARAHILELKSKLYVEGKDIETAHKFCKEAISVMAKDIQNCREIKDGDQITYLITLILTDMQILSALARWEEVIDSAGNLMMLLNFGGNGDALAQEENVSVMRGFKAYVEACLNGYREINDKERLGWKMRECIKRAGSGSSKRKEDVGDWLGISYVRSFIVDGDLEKAGEEFLKLKGGDMFVSINDAIAFVRIAKLLT
ncbi:MAG: hypothetical protein PHW46_06015, partial [Candidatus Omnitrophica bacterium]|nr:hypothetical protein [Candidatus Omnitrophota bacterium]